MKRTASPRALADGRKWDGKTEGGQAMADWESLCRRCGQCCFEKWVDGDGTIHPTTIACRFLDIHSRECRVYHKRFEVGEGCVRLTPEVVETVQWLPEDCAYVLNAKKQSQVQGPKSKVKNPKMR